MQEPMNIKHGGRPTKAHRINALADQLEGSLEALDELGAHLAAAHLDVAITRLREKAGALGLN